MINLQKAANNISIYFMVIYFYFYQFFEALGLKNLGLIMLFVALLCNLMSSIKKNKLLIEIRGIYFGWIFFAGILLFHNEYVKLGNYGSVLMPLTALSMVLFCTDSSDWCETALNAFIKVGMVHVLATLLFACSNRLYLATMPQLWGYFPVGTRGGDYGAAAGLTRHYSYNGIYCGLVFIFSASPLLTGAVESIKKRKYLCVAVMSLLAVILTQKRAHLLFGVAAVCLIYLICGHYKSLNRIGNIIVWGIFLILFMSIAALFIPSITVLFARFKISDSVDISTGRFDAWKVGMQLFEESKWFGKGWFFFPVYYNRSEFPEIHNIYIQYLCETGIIGSIIMIPTMFRTCWLSIKTLVRRRRVMSEESQIIVSASIGFQLFVLMYGLTGCCMTDITVMGYMVSVAIGLAQYRKHDCTSVGFR